VDRLRADLAAARAEAERAALWAAHLKLHLGELQRKVADFVRGASPAEWRHKEPRIVGFGLEFEEMKRLAALKDPEPPPADAASESRCAALAKECEELRKDKERLDWLERFNDVRLRHWDFGSNGKGSIIELPQALNYWKDRHNQRDERFCLTYRELIDHQIADAARADAARKEQT
jgi:hypothetical protein